MTSDKHKFLPSLRSTQWAPLEPNKTHLESPQPVSASTPVLIRNKGPRKGKLFLSSTDSTCSTGIARQKKGLLNKKDKRRIIIHEDSNRPARAKRWATQKALHAGIMQEMMIVAMTKMTTYGWGKTMRTRSLWATSVTPWYGSTYAQGILPYGISRYKIPGLGMCVSRMVACLGVHTARPPG